MFKNLGDKISKLVDSFKVLIKSQKPPLDLSKFDNPISERTDWEPLKVGGTIFRTHKFTRIMGVVYFKASRGNLTSSCASMLTGLIAPLVIISQLFRAGNSIDLYWFVIGAIPFVFFIMGLFDLLHSTKPIVFNKNTGYFWKGRLNKNENPGQKPLKVYCKLKDIVALQIISKRVISSSGFRSFFRSYEINIVLQDASRLNVIDHGNLKKLLEDAEQLASYLGVPIWDGTKY